MLIDWIRRAKRNFDLLAMAELDLSPTERVALNVADLEQRLASLEEPSDGSMTPTRSCGSRSGHNSAPASPA